MAANADPPEQGELHPCIDRQSAGESCGHSTTDAGATDPRDIGATDRTDLTVDYTTETLYLTQIALLEARVATLERRLESSEADLQHVVDRYERVLQGRDACRDEPLVADEFDIEASGPADADRTAGDDRTTEDDRTAERDGDRSTGALDRLRGLLG